MNYQASLSASYELDFWGKLRRGSEAARAQALAPRLARDGIDPSLISFEVTETAVIAGAIGFLQEHFELDAARMLDQLAARRNAAGKREHETAERVDAAIQNVYDNGHRGPIRLSIQPLPEEEK